MSARYEAAVASAAAPTAGAAWFEIRNPAGKRVQIEELCLVSNAATATRVGLIRATAQGTGGAATATGVAEDPGNPVAGNLVLAANAFTLAPTFGTAYLRRIPVGAAVGAGFHWSWPSSDRLVLAPSTSLVIVAIAAGPASSDLFVVWNET